MTDDAAARESLAPLWLIPQDWPDLRALAAAPDPAAPDAVAAAAPGGELAGASRVARTWLARQDNLRRGAG